MALKSGFFNSVKGDRVYNADDFNNIFQGVITEGICPAVGDAFRVTPGGNMTVYIGSGKMISAKGIWAINDSPYAINLYRSYATVDRYVNVGVHYDYNSEYRQAYFTYWSSADQPGQEHIPSRIYNEYEQSYIVATIRIRKGSTEILQSDITDTRADSSKCGYSTALLEHLNTSQWFAQYQAATDNFFKELQEWETKTKKNYDAWFKTLTEQLRIDTYIKKFSSNFTTTAATTAEIVIGIDEFDNSKDVLIANINGIMLNETEDFTVSGTGANSKIVLKNPIESGNKFTFMVIKSVIGSNEA